MPATLMSPSTVPVFRELATHPVSGPLVSWSEMSSKRSDNSSPVCSSRSRSRSVITRNWSPMASRSSNSVSVAADMVSRRASPSSSRPAKTSPGRPPCSRMALSMGRMVMVGLGQLPKTSARSSPRRDAREATFSNVLPGSRNASARSPPCARSFASALPRRWRVRRRPAGPEPPLPVPAMRPPRPSRPLPARRCPCGPRRRSPPVPAHPRPGQCIRQGLSRLSQRRFVAAVPQNAGDLCQRVGHVPEGGCQVPGGSPNLFHGLLALERRCPGPRPDAPAPTAGGQRPLFHWRPPGGGTDCRAAPVPPDLPAPMPRRLHPAHSQARRPGPPPGPSHRRRHPGSAPAGR